MFDFFTRKWLEETKSYKFIIVITIIYLIIYSYNYFILFDYEHFKKILPFATDNSVKQLIHDTKKIIWVFPLLTVLFIFIRIFLNTFCLLLGVYSKNEIISAKQIFKISLLSEFVYIFRDLIGFVYELIYGQKNINEFDGSLSIYSLIKNTIPSDSWAILPSKSLSIYSLLYLIVLSLLYKSIVRTTFTKSIAFVSIYFFLGFSLWIVVNMSVNLFIK